MRARNLRRIVRDRRGAVLLEAAIAITVLLILVFGTFDFGRLLFTANNLTSAAREGARVGSVHPGPERSAAMTTAIQAAVLTRAATFGGPALTNNNVAVTYNPPSGSMYSITVQVTDTLTYITPVARLLRFGTTRALQARSQFRWESAPNP